MKRKLQNNTVRKALKRVAETKAKPNIESKWKLPYCCRGLLLTLSGTVVAFVIKSKQWLKMEQIL